MDTGLSASYHWAGISRTLQPETGVQLGQSPGGPPLRQLSQASRAELQAVTTQDSPIHTP